MKAVIGTGSPGSETDMKTAGVRTSGARKDQVRLAKTCQVKPRDSKHASNPWNRPRMLLVPGMEVEGRSSREESGSSRRIGHPRDVRKSGRPRGLGALLHNAEWKPGFI